MVNKKRKKSRIHYLKLEIKIYKLIITELLVIITKNKVKIPDDLIKKMQVLYGGENGTEEKSKKKN